MRHAVEARDQRISVLHILECFLSAETGFLRAMLLVIRGSGSARLIAAGRARHNGLAKSLGAAYIQPHENGQQARIHLEKAVSTISKTSA